MDTLALRAIDREAQQNAKGYDWLRWSTRSIGHRLTGTHHGERAEASADSLFRVAGIRDVRFFPFQAKAWQRESVRVTVSGLPDTIITIPSVALAMTPDSAMVNATVIDVGNGLAADFSRTGDTVQGRIVLMNLQLADAPKGASNMHRSEKTALAIARGAAGVLFVNNVEGRVLLTGTASVTNDPIAIPAACISGADGAMLRAWAGRDRALRIGISMTNHNSPVTARDVIATIPGTGLPEEVIVVGGHLDSWDLATGATDNGLGSYSILDLARCFSALGLKPKRTIKFILFMGEEQGLLGSTALVNAWKKSGELDRVKCMINLDMSGHPSGFGVFAPGDLGDRVKTIQKTMSALDTSFKSTFNGDPGLHSDHQPFMMEGVPTIGPMCDLGQRVYRCYHSSCDDIDLVDPQAMVDNVRRVGQLLWSLANADALPGHFASSDLCDRLIAAGLEDKLRLQKDWRW